MASAAIAEVKEMREQTEARIADLKEAHELRVAEVRATAQTLAEQIDYLRMQLGPSAASLAVRPGAAPQGGPLTFPIGDFTAQPFLSEEEEELRALKAQGLLSDNELNEALAALGISGGADRIDIE